MRRRGAAFFPRTQDVTRFVLALATPAEWRWYTGDVNGRPCGSCQGVLSLVHPLPGVAAAAGRLARAGGVALPRQGGGGGIAVYALPTERTPPQPSRKPGKLRHRFRNVILAGSPRGNP